jgi:hypothetical protein
MMTKEQKFNVIFAFVYMAFVAYAMTYGHDQTVNTWMSLKMALVNMYDSVYHVVLNAFNFVI